jgi:D-amino-acid dehydrogenase
MQEKNLQGCSVAVVGAGIVGSCCAAQLVLQGAKVTLIDRAVPGMSGPSRGNAAHIAAPEIIPMATPGIVFSALGMLVDKRSALKIPLTQWPLLVPWLMRFAMNSKRSTHQKNIDILGSMNRSVITDVEQLFASTGLSDQLQRDGALYLYESPVSLQKAAGQFATRAKYGFESELLSAEQVYELEPNLAKIFAGGYKLPQWMTVSDPKRIVSGLVDFCISNAAEFVCEEVQDIKTLSKGVQLQYQNGMQSNFDKVLLSAGIWSKPLLKKLDTPKLIEAERGYNLTYTNPEIEVARAILFGDRGVVATPLDHGLRIGGWAEFGGIKRAANDQHFTVIDQIASQLFPNLNKQEHYRWMGHRPSTPDSLPIIERSATNPNVIYALGHGHLGLTQGPTTALKVSELM